ncbi:MAG: ATP-grasp domain-containing protein [Verrucomicrobiales bacterium]
MTHKLDSDDFFIHRVQQHAAELGMNFFLVEPLWVDSFYQRLERGEVWAKVMLNMHSEHHMPDEIYHRLVRLAHDRGVKVIDNPDLARSAFDKAQMHQRLVEHGFPVPNTILVPSQETGSFRLSEEQKAVLGMPFVVKPSMGYGRRGVILDAQDEQDISRSIQTGADPCYLLQRRIQPRMLGNVPAYFRIYHAFGAVWHCWWNCFTDRYRRVSWEDYGAYNLQAAEDLVRRIATLTGMNFFSTEIAMEEDGSFVLIDYVNDQCHMLSQSSNPKMGVPDDVVAEIAHKLVLSAAILAGKVPAPAYS